MQDSSAQKTGTAAPSAARRETVAGSTVLTFGMICCGVAMAVVLAVAAAALS